MRITEKMKNGLYRLKSGQEIYGEENGIRLAQVVGEYEDIEEELGLPLNVWIFFAKNQLQDVPERIYVENTVDDEKERERSMHVNGRPQRFILDVDFDAKTFQLQGTADEWCFRVPFSDYGKTIALTKEELL